MKNKKSVYLFIPLILIFTISCTCGAPSLTKLISNNEQNNIFEQVESEILVPEFAQDVIAEPENEAVFPTVGTGITGGDIDIFDVNHYFDGDYVTVIGLLKNNTEILIGGVDITIILYDADGKIMATESLYPLFSFLPPGETIPFYTSSSDWQDFSSYEFVVDDYYESDQEIVENVIVTNDLLELDTFSPVLIGELENTSSVTVEWVNVAAMIYDNHDILIDVVSTYSMLDAILPGEKSPFRIYMNHGWENYDHYDLIVQASKAYEEPADMSVTDYEVTSDDYSTTFTGSIKNNSAESVLNATIVGTLYDESGQIVAAEWTFAEEDDIPANGTGTLSYLFGKSPNTVR